MKAGHLKNGKWKDNQAHAKRKERQSSTRKMSKVKVKALSWTVVYDLKPLQSNGDGWFPPKLARFPELEIK